LNGATSVGHYSLVTIAIQYIGTVGLMLSGLYSGIDGPMASIGAGLSIVLVSNIKRVKWLRRFVYGHTVDLHAPEHHRLTSGGGGGGNGNGNGNGNGRKAQKAFSRGERKRSKNIGESLFEFFEHRK
jgi:hypothetical protein